MADSARHAAWHVHYEVRKVLSSGCGLDLGPLFSSPSYDAALDFAFDFLAAHDPGRKGEAGELEIVRVRGADAESVWRYSRDEADSTPDLVSLWGFDPTQSWLGPGTARA